MIKRDSFLKFFPIPDYLQFPAVGFDVSDGSVKFVELQRDGDSLSVGKFGVRPFSGDLTGTLSSIQKNFGFEMVNVSISEEESYFVRIRLPFIKPEEVRDAIELQIDSYIPYSAREVEFDYQILKTDPRLNGYIDVNIGVLPKKIVNRYLSIFKQANLMPTSLMIEAEAILRAAVPRGSKDVLMIVNIGRINTVLSIVARGAVWFSYTFKLGGDFLLKRLGETCALSEEDALKAKNEKGLINSSDNQDVFGCLLPMIGSIRDEISKHCKYWSEHRKEFLIAEGIDDINKIVVCGSQAVIPGLTSYLSGALGLKVVSANPWVNIFNFDQYVPPITQKDSMEYVTAIGLALSSLR